MCVCCRPVMRVGLACWLKASVCRNSIISLLFHCTCTTRKIDTPAPPLQADSLPFQPTLPHTPFPLPPPHCNSSHPHSHIHALTLTYTSSLPLVAVYIPLCMIRRFCCVFASTQQCGSENAPTAVALLTYTLMCLVAKRAWA